MNTEYSIELSDIAAVPSDLLILKHAQAFFGVDHYVARKLIDGRVCTREQLELRSGEHAIVATKGVIRPERVLFLGTLALPEFQYEEMRIFARRAIEIVSRELFPIRTITTTVHGTGYGLDTAESLQSLLRGFEEGIAEIEGPRPAEIKFVERDQRVARILTSALSIACMSWEPDPASKTEAYPKAATRRDETAMHPSVSPEPAKRHVFVAMPFSEEFEDVYEYGIFAPVRNCGLICEKTSETVFTGDILQRIRDRIETSWLVIADLTGARPNVYLEVGYAWGKGKDVILLARQGEELHFDVARHRCIYYKSIRHLAHELEKLLQGLDKASGL